jgi:TP901 family phage tail tape measure protein
MAGAAIDIEITGDALKVLKELQAQFGNLNKKVDDIEKETKASFAGIKKSIASVSLVSITQGFENFKNTLASVNAPGLEFESQMAELEAITGITGDALEHLGDKARKNAKEFGGDAGKSVETYKLLLSQLNPELAKSPDILSGMADSVSVLSKTMGGDTTGAVEVLTTAMNQYGVSLDNPIAAQQELNRMMNAMSAGAKEGSAELPALKAAIQNVGGDAKSSGVQFEGMVSAIELLDKAGKKGAEGGIALRNTIASLNQGRFLPKEVQSELLIAGINIEQLSDKSLSLTDRLRGLNPIVDDAALLSKLFGKENKLAAEALIRSTDEQDKMTAAITNTNTATEQANIIMGTRAEGLGRINAWFDDIKISISDVTGSFIPFMEIGFGALQGLSTIVPAIRAITIAVQYLSVAENRLLMIQKLRATWTGILSAATQIWTAVQWSLNIAMTANPIGLIIVAIAGLVSAVLWITDSFSVFGEFFVGFWNNLKEWFWVLVDFWATYLNPFGWLIELVDYVFPGMKDKIFGFFGDLWDGIYSLFVQPFVDAWNWIAGALGFGGEDPPELKASVEHTVENKQEVAKDLKASGYDSNMPLVQASGNNGNKTSASGSGGKKDKGAGFASAEKKEVNTTIEYLVKNLTIQTSNLKESPAKIRQLISEALIGGVRQFEAAI